MSNGCLSGCSEAAFEDEPRAWLEKRCPRLSREAQAEALTGWQRQLHAAGYVGLHWPVAYGGRGDSDPSQAQRRRQAPP
jgi:alkylation response protein AidB-like acyl-CoA dehydrogenase